MVSVLLSASVKGFSVFRMRDFFRLPLGQIYNYCMATQMHFGHIKTSEHITAVLYWKGNKRYCYKLLGSSECA